MIGKKRSLGFIAAALVAGVATAVVCTGEAFNPAHAQTVPFEATTRPLGMLKNVRPWLAPIPGGPQALQGKVMIVNF